MLRLCNSDQVKTEQWEMISYFYGFMASSISGRTSWSCGVCLSISCINCCKLAPKLFTKLLLHYIFCGRCRFLVFRVSNGVLILLTLLNKGTFVDCLIISHI